MDKSILYDYNAEATILSAIINEEKFITTAVNEIEDHHFYLGRHKLIYKAMNDLFLNQAPIDIITIADSLGKRLEIAGGSEYLQELSNLVYGSYGWKGWFKIINDKYLLRKSTNIANSVLAECNSGYQPEDIISKAQSEFLSINDAKKKPYRDICSITTDLIERKEKVISGEITVEKYFTGISQVDRMIHMKKGKLVVIGAKRSVGKSALANQIAFMNAKHYNRKFGIFNMEMTDEELLEREISRESKLTLNQIADPMANDIIPMHEAVMSIQNSEVLIDTASTQTLAKVRAKSMQMKHELGGLDGIVIDYLQLMTATEGDNREQQVASLGRGLKRIAKDLDICVIALSQLNEDGKTRESKAQEQDADIIIKIFRPLFENRKDKKIDILGRTVIVSDKAYSIIDIDKNRMGDTGVVEAWFVGAHQYFKEYENEMDLL